MQDTVNDSAYQNYSEVLQVSEKLKIVNRTAAQFITSVVVRFFNVQFKHCCE